MRLNLFPASLLATLLLASGFSACTDHAGSMAMLDQPGPPPISNPDPTTVGVPDPGTGTGNSEPVRTGNPTPTTTKGGEGKPPQGGQPVPEPGTLLLVGSGLAGVALLRRRRKQ